ncbi:MAG: arginyltransferase [Pontibacterium sp.]
MSNLQTLHFYATPEHDCSYLKQHQARTLFVDPAAHINKQTYTELSDLGFRRSGSHIYRPHCSGCQACTSIRIIQSGFKPTKSQRRVINKNKDLVITQATPRYTDEYYQLYFDYITQRHADGDMFPPSKEQFISFLVDGSERGIFLEFRDATGILKAIAVTDELNDGLAPIYTFYDPCEPKRSLGQYCILSQIELTRSRKLNYVYLGYWVKDCRKMNYKVLYRPFELLIDGRWVAMR